MNPSAQRVAIQPGQRVPPLILEPDFSLTIALYPTPAPDGAIGEVVSSEQKGIRPREIGRAQAWLYREERTLILWDLKLQHPVNEDIDHFFDILNIHRRVEVNPFGVLTLADLKCRVGILILDELLQLGKSALNSTRV